jgi:Zn-dependent protease with chaperone function
MAAVPDSNTSATWFDGEVAAGHRVRVEVANRNLRLFAADGTLLRTEALEALQLSEPSRRAPRFVYFADGSTLEVQDATSFNQALDALGRRPNFVARLQNSALAATSALALLIGGFIYAYTSGVPLLARWVAFALPESVEARLGQQFEMTLNLEMFKASSLPEVRQAQLRSLLHEAAARGARDLTYALKFRTTQEGGGVNAFSLPGGTIILLDGLVEAAANDRQVLAVLGHELGHVANKHGLRNLLQVLAIGAVANAAWGDFAGVAANVPVVFGALQYSRAFEFEADSYAAAFLRANDLDTQPLIEFFELIADRKEGHERSELADMFSTHPHTKERIERLKRM